MRKGCEGLGSEIHSVEIDSIKSHVDRGETHEFGCFGGPFGLAKPPRVAYFTSKVSHTMLQNTS